MLQASDTRRAGGEGVETFGVVDGSGRGVALIFAGGEPLELDYDACAQTVLPWQNLLGLANDAEGEAAMVLDAQALPSLAEQVWALHKKHKYVHLYLILDTSTSGSLSAVSTPIFASNIIV